ncbi:hypothetical protein [Profundibacterium mesophilum]|uniref:Tetratricopeptide repeat-like domain-containing protein n=1 Tax=Profundibacterium mesophilum KAUST100406-0324 TaxID=1037889 RepID=A0A921NP14_9RHOB|nr:hypothetical protein [Profundibacterium mesophilum]KAF0674827.1 uncharacterized protein PMES_02903 [Profundibacterium mesophilum KAUST100406-0324]
MSNTDSFIDEVSEEVRRERLFGFIKRYGWIAVLAVVLIVGGAAWNEWRQARDAAQAQAFGDAILASLAKDSPEARRAALLAIPAEGAQRAVIAMMAAEGSDGAGPAVTQLEEIVAGGELPQLYRDLAALKIVMIEQDTLPLERIAALLEPLQAPGAPFRLLALEQLALAEVAAEQKDAALERLRAILEDGDATPDLRRRVSQLIVALGGSLDAG